MEKTDNELRTATLEKLADAMGLSVEQFTDWEIESIKVKFPQDILVSKHRLIPLSVLVSFRALIGIYA